MKLSERQQVFSINIAKLIMYAEEIGVKLTFGEAYRTKSQQFLYYRGFKIKEYNNQLSLEPSKVRSWTMNSKHLSRLAVDFNFFIDGKLTYTHDLINKLGAYWESLNDANKHGGRFNDTPHFQG